MLQAEWNGTKAELEMDDLLWYSYPQALVHYLVYRNTNQLALITCLP